MNHYETLGVLRTATHTEITQAWRRAASLYHPDKQGGDADKFHAAKTAAECLLNVDSKHAYDSQGETVNASGKIDVVTPEQVEKALSAPYAADQACILCGGTHKVRVGARGFWVTRDCPNCTRGV